MSKDKEYLRSEVSRGIKDGKGGVDREKKVIYGFAVMTKMQVKDSREWIADDTTLDQTVAAGNSRKIGLKSRFGHPNMSETALGTYLGRAKNFRKDGDIVRADLFFSDTAFNTPDGDLASYVMDLAEKDPDAFGSSVVMDKFEIEDQVDEKGELKKDEDGKLLPGFLRVIELSAADIVDEPALNNGMFGQFYSNTVLPSAVMTNFLDKFLNDEDAVIKTVAFLNRYLKHDDRLKTSNKNEEEIVMELKDVTVDQLKSDRADIVEAFRAEFSKPVELPAVDIKAELSAGISAALIVERERVVGLLAKLDIEEYKDMKSHVLESIKSGESIEDCEAKLMKQRVKDLEANKAPDPGANAPQDEDLSHLLVEDRCKIEFEKSDDIKKEFKTLSAYTAFKKHEKSIKVFAKIKK